MFYFVVRLDLSFCVCYFSAKNRHLSEEYFREKLHSFHDGCNAQSSLYILQPSKFARHSANAEAKAEINYDYLGLPNQFTGILLCARAKTKFTAETNWKITNRL